MNLTRDKWLIAMQHLRLALESHFGKSRSFASLEWHCFSSMTLWSICIQKFSRKRELFVFNLRCLWICSWSYFVYPCWCGWNLNINRGLLCPYGRLLCPIHEGRLLCPYGRLFCPYNISFLPLVEKCSVPGWGDGLNVWESDWFLFPPVLFGSTCSDGLSLSLLKRVAFLVVTWAPLFAVTMEPFIAIILYGFGLKGGLNLFALCFFISTNLPRFISIS